MSTMSSRKWKKSLDLCLSCILLSSSLFTLYLVVRGIDASSYLSTICQINKGEMADRKKFSGTQSLQLYIFLIQIAISITSIMASVICIVASTDYLLTKWSLLVGIILCIVSTFGSLMIVVIAVLHQNESLTFLILKRMIQLCLSVFTFVSSFYNVIVLIHKYRTKDRMRSRIRIYTTQQINRDNFGEEFAKHVLISVPVLVTIINLSGGAAILGFAMGRASMVKDDEPCFLGGLHSGILAITSCIAVIFKIYVYKHQKPQKTLVIIILLVVTILSSLISFYTEDIELSYHILEYDRAESSKPHSHYIMLAKSSLTVFSNLFIIVFGVPLLACICECLTVYLVPATFAQSHVDNSSHTDYDNMTLNKQQSGNNYQNQGDFREDSTMGTLRRQNNTAFTTLDSGPHKLYTANGLIYNLHCDTNL